MSGNVPVFPHGDSGQGTRLNPARNNGKRCTACTRLMLCTRLSCTYFAVRVHGRELMCLMLMLSARGDHVSARDISRSARRLMESCHSLNQPVGVRACVRAPACLMAVMMVMGASTPPQRASRLALLFDRFINSRGHQSSSGVKPAARKSNLSEKHSSNTPG